MVLAVSADLTDLLGVQVFCQVALLGDCQIFQKKKCSIVAELQCCYNDFGGRTRKIFSN
jgi:hypothetical protein